MKWGIVNIWCSWINVLDKPHRFFNAWNTKNWAFCVEKRIFHLSILHLGKLLCGCQDLITPVWFSQVKFGPACPCFCNSHLSGAWSISVSSVRHCSPSHQRVRLWREIAESYLTWDASPIASEGWYAAKLSFASLAVTMRPYLRGKTGFCANCINFKLPESIYLMDLPQKLIALNIRFGGK